MDTVYIVRGENGGEPESFTLGAYATEAEAKARLTQLETGVDEYGDPQGFEFMWIDELKLGQPCFVGNR